MQDKELTIERLKELVQVYEKNIEIAKQSDKLDRTVRSWVRQFRIAFLDEATTLIKRL